MDWKKIDAKYRPTPFWSWNDRITPAESKRQIAQMEEAGIGGFIMHARGGLQTPYLGDEWFENVSAAVKEGRDRGMYPWAYDEDGWPSGFGGGYVNGLGVDYQQKFLRIEEGDRTCETTVCHAQGYHLYYEANPFYVDLLDKKVVKAFIDHVYRPYVEKFGSKVGGFFTDEPEVCAGGKISWSFTFPEEYERRYHDDLLPHLPELFHAVGDYQTTRYRFWKMVTDQFGRNYLGQIQEFCRANGVKLTGHMYSEANFWSQLFSNGAVMPQYEFFDYPGVDLLTANHQCQILTFHQVGSAAQQLGKERVMTESYAGCGHGVSHDVLKNLVEMQLARGITYYVQHLHGYSLRGLRKRDWPPAMGYQQPWWKDYRPFNDALSRIGMIMTEGKVQVDTLLIEPMTTAWVLFEGETHPKEFDDRYNAFVKQMQALERKHISFHLGDETLMERHAHVEGKTLVIGTQRYTRIVLPDYLRFFENTERLLEEYKKNGGEIVTVEEIPENDIVSVPEILYTKRLFENETVHYFVNTTEKAYDAVIKRGGKIIDEETGELRPFNGHYHFEPLESLLVLEDGTEQQPNFKPETAKSLDLSGKWKVVASDLNSLTLDSCDYWFDGKKMGEREDVLTVMQKAVELERPVHVRMRFRGKVEAVPKKLYLVTETPNLYTLTCNGEQIPMQDCGYAYDQSFRKLDISSLVRLGENYVEAEMDFAQKPETYENIRKSAVFESEKNRLRYDCEIEPFYLLGNFGVRSESEWTNGVKATERRTAGDFVLTALPSEVEISNLQEQGFPFFAGSITLEKKFEASEKEEILLSCRRRNVNVVGVEVNGRDLGKRIIPPYRVDLSEALCNGENTVRLTLTNNLRNLLGPHHMSVDTNVTPPGYFQKTPCIWNANPTWDARYGFAAFGLEQD